MNNLKILLTTKLSNKKLKDKVRPIIDSKNVSQIDLVRAFATSPLDKVRYFSLPNFIRKNLFLEIFCIFFYLPIRILLNRPNLLIGIYYVPYGYFVQFFGKIFNIPTVCNLIGSDISLYRKKPLIWKVLMRIMQKSKLLTTTGNNTKRLLIHDGFDDSQIIVMPNPIDPKLYFPKKMKKEYDIISVSNLRARKKVDLILLALAVVKKEYPNIRYAIIGEGPEMKSLEKLCEAHELNQNVDFLGERKDVNDLLNKSNIFISASSNEGLSVSIMEAMACKKPVISTDVGDIRDIIQNHRNGILVPKDNYEAIAKEILFLLDNPEKAKEIGSKALSVLQTNSPQAVTKKWEEIFRLLKIIDNPQ